MVITKEYNFFLPNLSVSTSAHAWICEALLVGLSVCLSVRLSVSFILIELKPARILFQTCSENRVPLIFPENVTGS